MFKNKAGLIFFFTAFILLLIVASLFMFNGHEKRIEQKVESVHGVLISKDSKAFDSGPFKIKLKDDYVYQFEYEQYGKTKEGWVRFRVFSVDWYMDGEFVD